MDEVKGEKRMVTNHKVTGNAISMPLGLALGLVVSLVVTLAMAALIANLVLGEKIAQEAVGYGAMATVILSPALGALIASARIKRRRLLVCLVTGLCYYLALLSVTALFFGGQYQGMGVTALLVFAGTGGVALMGIKGESGGSNRRKKYRHR